MCVKIPLRTVVLTYTSDSTRLGKHLGLVEIPAKNHTVIIRKFFNENEKDVKINTNQVTTALSVQILAIRYSGRVMQPYRRGRLAGWEKKNSRQTQSAATRPQWPMGIRFSEGHQGQTGCRWNSCPDNQKHRIWLGVHTVRVLFFSISLSVSINLTPNDEFIYQNIYGGD